MRAEFDMIVRRGCGSRGEAIRRVSECLDQRALGRPGKAL